MIYWSVRRPAVVLAAAVAITLGGVVAFTRLALATRTTVELPRLQVRASWPGASAELIETYLTSPIEAAVQAVRGVKKVSSISDDDGASLTIELQPDADVQIARLSILERLELLRPEFPPGSTPPQVSNFVPQELEEEPLLRLTLVGPYTPGALQKLADDELRPRLSAVPGVAGISTGGGTEFGVSVSYDALLLRQLRIAPQDLSSALESARIVQALGEERLGASERQVVLRDQPEAVEQLAGLPIRGPGGRVFRLGELADIRPDEDTRGQFLRIDGQPAIMLTISRLAGADAIKTAAGVRRQIDALEPTLPPRVTIRVASDSSTDLAEQLQDLLIRGAIAFGAVLLVLALWLRDVRAVTLVMITAAVSVAGTALGLYIFDIPANMLTLAGLAMGIGVLVQNGLVVAERLGTEPDTQEGRARAGRRILPAILGATLTTAVVLFPFLYLQGNARAAFMPFASAFLLALGWSIAAAVLVIPALAGGHRVHEAKWVRARRAYAKTLKAFTRFKYVTLVTTVAVLGVLTWGFIEKVPRFSWGGFGEERTTLSAFLYFPRGSDPDALDASMRELESIVVGRPGVERVVSQSYGIFGAGMRVLFTREAGYTATPQEMEEQLTQRAVFIGGATVSVRGQGPGFSSGVGAATSATFRIRVMGYSYTGVEALAKDLQSRLEQIPRVRDVDINAASFFSAEKETAVTLEPDRAALARYGITATDVAQAVAREVRGPVGRQLLEIGGDELPVTVKSTGARERTLEELREAIVPTNEESPVRVADLATVSEREALGSISREDQQYIRVVSYDFRGPNRLARRTHDAFMKSVSTPPGYKVEEAAFNFGELDRSEQALWLVFAVGIALVILAVAIVFDSAWAAAVVFLSLPIALGGVMAAFWAVGAAFTREAAVGVILVIGLAVNQVILVVDAALERRRANEATRGISRLSPLQAIHAAVDRSGMIMLASLASLASLVPLAVGNAPDSLFGAIALATAGGTVFGTLGAMFVVPVALAGKTGRRS